MLAVDVRCPSDKDRTIIHRFSLGETWATFSPRSVEPMKFPWTEVAVILRGVRASQTELERTENRTTYVPTGDGIPMHYASTDTAKSTRDSSEQVIFVYLRDGRRALLAAHELAFACLGPAMQPSASGNMAELANVLRQRAQGAFYDDRLVRLGRRRLPFGVDVGSRVGTANTVTIRSSTTSTLDVLAEVMWRAVAEELLP